MPDENPAESPSPEPSLEPENTPEVSPEPVLTELEKLTALVDSLTDAEEGPGGTESAGEAEASFEERYAAALEAVLTAWDGGNIAPEEAVCLLDTVDRPAARRRVPGLRDLAGRLCKVCKARQRMRRVNEKMEYIHQMLAALAGAAGSSGRQRRTDSARKQLVLTLSGWINAPACTRWIACIRRWTAQCACSIRKAANWQTEEMELPESIRAEEAEATALREELAASVWRWKSRGAIAELMLVDVDFDADEKAARK